MDGIAAGSVGPIPITIGVIGHRDLIPADLDRLRHQIREIITGYRATFPATPVVLLSAYAEGADEIAVEACAEIPHVTTIAVLPMPLEEYEKDFTTPGSLNSFRTLIARAASTILVDDTAPHPLSSDEALGSRDAAYQRCARFLSLQSHVLIAVWDGKPPALIGGTADTLRNRVTEAGRFRDVDGMVELWPMESGVTVQVPAGRQSHQDQPVAPDGRPCGRSAQVIASDWSTSPWSATVEDDVAAEIDSLNRQILEEGGSGSRGKRLTQLVESVADHRAVLLQRRFRRLAASVLIAGVTSLMLVNLERSASPRALVASAIAVICVTGVLWWVLSHARLKDRFQQARALAEGARVQQAWLDAGLTTSVADHYLLGQPDVSWIRRTLRIAWLSDIARQATEPTPADAPTVARAWMREQVDYFTGAAGRSGAIARNRRKANRYQLLSFAGLALAAIAFVPDLMRLTVGTSLSASSAVFMQAVWEFGLASAAASAAYGQLMAFREIERQYQVSESVYRQGLKDVEAASSSTDGRPAVRAAMVAVGREALRETGSWLALNRDRSVRPV